MASIKLTDFIRLTLTSSVGLVTAAASPPLRLPAASLPANDSLSFASLLLAPGLEPNMYSADLMGEYRPKRSPAHHMVMQGQVLKCLQPHIKGIACEGAAFTSVQESTRQGRR